MDARPSTPETTNLELCEGSEQWHCLEQQFARRSTTSKDYRSFAGMVRWEGIKTIQDLAQFGFDPHECDDDDDDDDAPPAPSELFPAIDPARSADDTAEGAPSPGYADALDAYVAAEWHGVLPIPRGQKHPPPNGFTGWSGTTPDVQQRDEWKRTHPADNVALRIPDGIIGIDIDNYGDKPGGRTIADLENELGEIPDTWRSTSRPDDDVSGIRFYAVPPGYQAVPQLPGVELIQPHHRYAVVAPSVHPEGRRYVWFAPGETETPEDLETVPQVRDLPPLPLAWVEYLKDGRTHEGIGNAPATPQQVGEWIGNGIHCDGDHTAVLKSAGFMHKVLRPASEKVGNGVSRHEALVAAAVGMCRDAAKTASYPRDAAAGALIEWFLGVATKGTGARTVADAEREARSAISWAIANNEQAAPPENVNPETGEVCTPSTDLVESTKDPVTGQPISPNRKILTHPDGGEQFTEEDWIDLEFWHSRQYLRDIFNAALLRYLSPDALYGVLKARAGCTIHNYWQLPPIIASVGAINPYSIIRCIPGDGKTGAVGAGFEMMPFTEGNEGLGYDIYNMPKFTGAGLAEAYMSEIETVDPGDPKKKIKEKKFNGRAVYCVIDEGRALIDSSSNSKTDMISPLLQARMGTDIGSQGASIETTRMLPQKLYRFCPVILAQPDIMCDLLQWSELGLPQRFTAYNGSALRFSGMKGEGDRDNLPTGRRAESPAPPSVSGGVPIRVAESVEQEIVRLRILRSTPLEDWTDEDRSMLEHGDIDMAAHTNFNRLTEAAVLAFMDGRSDVNGEDWELAGYPIATSGRLWQRAQVQAEQRKPVRKSDKQRDAEQVEGKVDRLERLQEQAFTRFAKVLLRDNPSNEPVEITASLLGKEVPSRVRKNMGVELGTPQFTPTDMAEYGCEEGAIEKVGKGYIVSAEWVAR